LRMHGPHANASGTAALHQILEHKTRRNYRRLKGWQSGWIRTGSSVSRTQ
jgi:hypothetical protein